MDLEGNTEGTPQPGDSVETGRGASADWSNLREDYERIGNLNRLARHYHTRNETVRAELVRQGIPLKPRGHVKGQKKSEAWREASRRHWEDPEWREAQRKKWLVRLPGMQAPRNGGSPLETYLHRALRKAGISFSTQRQLLGRYVCDILITQKPVVIEADGNMHLHAVQREKDARRNADMRAAGYEVYRFPGGEICRDADGCIQRVIKAAGLAPDAVPVFDIRNGLLAEANPRWKGGKPEWTCEACGKIFRSWPRGYGKPCRTCSRECQSEWQRRTRASVATRGPRKDSRAPEHLAKRVAEIRCRWDAEDREKQMMVQSGLHESREDVQRSAEMTGPATLF
jgi:very-short-patch-repair endonuclease